MPPSFPATATCVWSSAIRRRRPGRARRLIGGKGVDMVFGHVGVDAWQGSLLSMKRGVRPVIDAGSALETFGEGLARMEGRDVSGNILVSL